MGKRESGIDKGWIFFFSESVMTVGGFWISNLFLMTCHWAEHEGILKWETMWCICSLDFRCFILSHVTMHGHIKNMQILMSNATFN